jgi:hypothetical protein
MFSSQNYKSRIIKELVKKADFNTKSLYLNLKAPARHFEYTIGNLRSARQRCYLIINRVNSNLKV